MTSPGLLALIKDIIVSGQPCPQQYHAFASVTSNMVSTLSPTFINTDHAPLSLPVWMWTSEAGTLGPRPRLIAQDLHPGAAPKSPRLRHSYRQCTDKMDARPFTASSPLNPPSLVTFALLHRRASQVLQHCRSTLSLPRWISVLKMAEWDECRKWNCL